MEFEICDNRNGQTCKQVKGTIQINDNGVSLNDPAGNTFVYLGVDGQVYFTTDKWSSSYKLALRSSHEHTYDMEKIC